MKVFLLEFIMSSTYIPFHSDRNKEIHKEYLGTGFLNIIILFFLMADTS